MLADNPPPTRCAINRWAAQLKVKDRPSLALFFGHFVFLRGTDFFRVYTFVSNVANALEGNDARLQWYKDNVARMSCFQTPDHERLAGDLGFLVR